jgi:hypothetical protein
MRRVRAAPTVIGQCLAAVVAEKRRQFHRQPLTTGAFFGIAFYPVLIFSLGAVLYFFIVLWNQCELPPAYT